MIIVDVKAVSKVIKFSFSVSLFYFRVDLFGLLKDFMGSCAIDQETLFQLPLKVVEPCRSECKWNVLD